MARSRRVGILIAMPAALKRAVVARAHEEGAGMNDTIVGALARHYGVAYTPTERRAKKPTSGSGDVLIRVTPTLRARIQRDAARKESNTTHTVLNVLARTFAPNLIIPEPRRRTPYGGGRRSMQPRRDATLREAGRNHRRRLKERRHGKPCNRQP
jgi:hypothetical protein